MGRLSSTNQGNSSEKSGTVAKRCADEEKEDGDARKLVRTATKDIDETIVWDEV